jgi:hypothetical protein
MSCFWYNDHWYQDANPDGDDETGENKGYTREE